MLAIGRTHLRGCRVRGCKRMRSERFTTRRSRARSQVTHAFRGDPRGRGIGFSHEPVRGRGYLRRNALPSIAARTEGSGSERSQLRATRHALTRNTPLSRVFESTATSCLIGGDCSRSGAVSRSSSRSARTKRRCSSFKRTFIHGVLRSSTRGNQRRLGGVGKGCFAAGRCR